MTVARQIAAMTGALTLAGGLALAQGTTWSFENLPAGRPPGGFTFAGAPADRSAPWVILRDGSNGVLAHTPQEGMGPQIAVADGVPLADVRISARLRFADRAGSAGLVWRYRDPGNYYLAMLDLRTQDVRIYRVAAGNRTRLEDEDDLELDPGVWSSLKVEHRGTRMRMWINGVPVGGARDRAPLEAGTVGFWTAADASAWFDDLHAEPLREPERNTRSN